jgi:(p)ppGpp synthase/HD superfamily hydrolase
MTDNTDWQSKFQLCEYSDKLLSLIAALNKNVSVPVDILEIKKACHIAREYHGDQKRKSGDPYYSHPLEVAYLFAKYVAVNAPQYYTTELIIVAILHDTLEDTALTSEMIRKIFNHSVASGVEDLTRNKDGAKHSALHTLILLSAQGDKEGIIHIKLQDRIHNMQTIGFMPVEKQLKIIEETVTGFLVSSASLSLYEAEEELWALCSVALKNANLLETDFSEDNSLLLFLGFQSDLSQKQNL